MTLPRPVGHRGEEPLPGQLDIRAPSPVPGVSRLSRARVLVIGINFTPEVTGIAPYTAAFSDSLATAARSVQVFTGVPHYPAWQVDPPYRSRLRSREETTLGATVVRHRHYVPARQTAATRALYELTFMGNVLA